MKFDTIILMGMVKHSQSSQNSKFAVSLKKSLNKKVKDEIDFCMQINIKVSYKLISASWVSKFPSK